MIANNPDAMTTVVIMIFYLAAVALRARTMVTTTKIHTTGSHLNAWPMLPSFIVIFVGVVTFVGVTTVPRSRLIGEKPAAHKRQASKNCKCGLSCAH